MFDNVNIKILLLLVTKHSEFNCNILAVQEGWILQRFTYQKKVGSINNKDYLV